MTHISDIIEIKEHGDDQVSYLFRCCGNPKTDSWKTISVTFSDADHDRLIAGYYLEIQTLHDAKLKALNRASKLVKGI